MKLKTLRPSPDSSVCEFERKFVKPKAGRTLIVGSQVYGDKEDRRALYADAVGVDMLQGPGVDLVLNLEEELPGDLGQFYHIECMSVLEHSRRPWLLAANLDRLMRPGATIFVTVPFVFRIHGYPDDYFRFTPNGIRAIFPGVTWEAMALASDVLSDGPKLRMVRQNGDYPYFARTETVGFGRK